MWARITPIEPGDDVVVLGQGIVGNLYMQAVRERQPGRVITVDATALRCQISQQCGADTVINVAETDSVQAVKDLTDGKGVDVAYDSVGKDSAKASLDSLKSRGWFVTYGNASGAVEPLAPTELNRRGSLVMTRPGLFHFVADEAGLKRGAAALFGALRTGTLKANIGQTFNLEDAAEAHRAIESGKTTGSTLLKP